MAAYIVTYDLHQTGQNYECIKKKLETIPKHWHMQGSVWVIETEQTAVQLRDSLLSCLDSNDNLLVALLAGEAAWRGFKDNGSKWLKTLLSAYV